MGWCHEFGVTVREGCGHPMTAGESSCQCDVCGMVCEGQFAGCSTVWERGPRAFVPVWPSKPSGGSLPSREPGPVGVSGPAARARPAAEAEAEAEPAPPEPNGNSDLHTPEGAGPPPPTAAPLPVSAADDMRGQVFEWLHDSFESLRSQLRVLSDAVSRQERALDSMTEAGAAAERLSRLADVLPDQIGDAVYGAITSRGTGPDAASTGDVRTHEVELGDTFDPLTGGPGPTPGHEPSAPTARSGINRSGWQDRLLALGPAGAQSGD